MCAAAVYVCCVGFLFSFPLLSREEQEEDRQKRKRGKVMKPVEEEGWELGRMGRR